MGLRQMLPTHTTRTRSIMPNVLCTRVGAEVARNRAPPLGWVRMNRFTRGYRPIHCVAMTNAFLEAIHGRKARVGIIGQGYVGLPLSLLFREAGFQVTGFDVDPRKVEALRRGESYIQHIGADRVTAAVKSGRYEATTDFDRLRDCDAIAICVPTPLGRHREPDNSYIHATGREIAKRLRRGQLVVLESTT